MLILQNGEKFSKCQISFSSPVLLSVHIRVDSNADLSEVLYSGFYFITGLRICSLQL